MQGLWQKTVSKILSENPLDQDVFIDLHHETSGGFLCVFLGAENFLQKFPGLLSRRHFAEF